jgi:hypothetical protein
MIRSFLDLQVQRLLEPTTNILIDLVSLTPIRLAIPGGLPLFSYLLRGVTVQYVFNNECSHVFCT